MAFLSYGMASGLAQRFDFKGYNEELDRQEQLDRQAKQDVDNKMKYWSDKMKIGKVYTEHGRRQINEHFDKTVRELARIASQNPNWESDPITLAQINKMTESLSDNDIVARELRVEQGRQQMMKDMASGDFDKDDFAKMQNDYINYSKFGNTGGEKMDGSNEFIYNSPTKYDNASFVSDYSKLVGEKAYMTDNGSGIITGQKAQHSDVLNAMNAAKSDKRWSKWVQKFNELHAAGNNMYDTPEDAFVAAVEGSKSSTINYQEHRQSVEGARANGTANPDEVYDPYGQFVEHPLSTAQNNMVQVNPKAAAHLFDMSSDGTMNTQTGMLLLMPGKANGVQIWNRLTATAGAQVTAKPTGTIMRNMHNSSYYGEYNTQLPLSAALSPIFKDPSDAKKASDYIGKTTSDVDLKSLLKPEYASMVNFEVDKNKGTYTGNVTLTGYKKLRLDAAQKQAFNSEYQTESANMKNLVPAGRPMELQNPLPLAKVKGAASVVQADDGVVYFNAQGHPIAVYRNQ